MSIKTTQSGIEAVKLIRGLRKTVEADPQVDNAFAELEEWAESLPHMHLEVADKPVNQEEFKEATLRAMQGILGGVVRYEKVEPHGHHAITTPTEKEIAELAVRVGKKITSKLDDEEKSIHRSVKHLDNPIAYLEERLVDIFLETDHKNSDIQAAKFSEVKEALRILKKHNQLLCKKYSEHPNTKKS